jgi:hypothetical protein
MRPIDIEDLLVQVYAVDLAHKKGRDQLSPRATPVHEMVLRLESRVREDVIYYAATRTRPALQPSAPRAVPLGGTASIGGVQWCRVSFIPSVDQARVDFDRAVAWVAVLRELARALDALGGFRVSGPCVAAPEVPAWLVAA